MLHKSTIDFLKKLKRNNNRDWFNANKKLYEDARYDFEVFVFELIQKIAEFDETVSGLEPKDCMFRIYKDVRFSKDKTPYKTNFGAAINQGGSGLYMPAPDKLLAVRNSIAAKSAKFKNIVESKEFKKNFGKLWNGDTLKTVPKGFDKVHPMAEYLKLKSWICDHTVKEEKALSKNYGDYIAKIFKTAKPFNDFLNDAIGVG